LREFAETWVSRQFDVVIASKSANRQQQPGPSAASALGTLQDSPKFCRSGVVGTFIWRWRKGSTPNLAHQRHRNSSSNEERKDFSGHSFYQTGTELRNSRMQFFKSVADMNAIMKENRINMKKRLMKHEGTTGKPTQTLAPGAAAAGAVCDSAADENAEDGPSQNVTKDDVWGPFLTREEAVTLLRHFKPVAGRRPKRASCLHGWRELESSMQSLS
jgi:hypothetical protein